MIDPSIIAAFVDDALCAAGGRAVHRIRVQSSLAPYLDSHRGPVQGADDLSPGDVSVDVDGGMIGATLETRAERLVAAAVG